ncbi:MAG: hypothetical protein CMJ77_24730 [Planctomycetaceae bacterium]|nr:hypothetical protein [Planctomycetaceae bacterium]
MVLAIFAARSFGLASVDTELQMIRPLAHHFNERLMRWQMITRSLLNPIPRIRDLLPRRLSALDVGRCHARSRSEFRRDTIRNKYAPLFHRRRSGRR